MWLANPFFCLEFDGEYQLTSGSGMALHICSNMDSGNIDVVDASDVCSIQLQIREDTRSDFLQWFYFGVSGVRGHRCRISIINAGNTSYPGGWEGYDVATSIDRQYWYRTPADYDGQQLSWTFDAQTDLIWFAYFAPYTLDRHLDFVSAAATGERVRYESLGTTHRGCSIDYLQLGALGAEAANDVSRKTRRRQLWVIARQHPGEAMAEWWMEGFLDRLLDQEDAVSCRLRDLADINIVPNMNPDGTCLGHLRTNALGINLNREWQSPSLENSPEVYHVRQRMHETGVDLALDVHGDEVLPYNFIAGTEGIPGWNEQRDSELVAFKRAWARVNPDFQVANGYPKTPPGQSNLGICSNYVAHTFNCLAMTLEMPFKDTLDRPRSLTGWSPERSMRLGASFVEVAFLQLSGQIE